MRDPMTWSLPLGRVFGIQVRLHLLLPIVFVGLVLRAATKEGLPSGYWIDVAMILGLMFFSVLLHEFGHCFGARLVEGDANEVLLWPLGGLANCEVPHTPRANFITTLAGPLVNVVLCLLCGVLLALHDPALRPPLDPFDAPTRGIRPGCPEALKTAFEHTDAIPLTQWAGGSIQPVNNMGLIVLARLFWVNWVLFLVNMVLVGFPMDAGRLFQSVLWKYVGYRQATMAAVFAGFVTAIIVGVFGIVKEEVLALCLALFIYVSCRHQWIVLEMGGEESLFGYDFSQGYTSLERDQPIAPPQQRRRRQNWFQRWLQRRNARKAQREQEQREAEETRMDSLLEKVARDGLTALTDEERRFLKRVSDRYRHRQ
jgi:Zn-dependent protease